MEEREREREKAEEDTKGNLSSSPKMSSLQNKHIKGEKKANE